MVRIWDLFTQIRPRKIAMLIFKTVVEEM